MNPRGRGIRRGAGRCATAALLAAIALLPAAAGCQTEETVVRYNPFLAGVPGAVHNTEPVGRPNVSNEFARQAEDPAELVREDEDGRREIIAKTGRHLMIHIVNCLDQNDDELWEREVLATELKEHLAKLGSTPKQYADHLRKNRESIEVLFTRMPFGEFSPTVIIDQVGKGRWTLRLTGQARRNSPLTRLHMQMERGNWRLLWID